MTVVKVERIIEAEHSQLQRGTYQRKVSGSYVSMLLRMPEITSLFEQGPAPTTFVSAFQRLQDPNVLAETFHWQGHPRWKEAVDASERRSHFYALANELLYGLDSESLFASVNNMEMEAKQGAKVVKKAINRWEKTMALARSTSLSLNSIHLQVALDHLHLRLACASFVSMQHARFTELNQALQVAPQSQPVDESSMQLDCEEVSDGLLDTTSTDITFLRIISDKAGRLKLPHLPAPSSKRLGRQDLVITTHSHVSLTETEALVLNEPSQVSGCQNALAVLRITQTDMSDIKGDDAALG